MTWSFNFLNFFFSTLLTMSSFPSQIYALILSLPSFLILLITLVAADDGKSQNSIVSVRAGAGLEDRICCAGLWQVAPFPIYIDNMISKIYICHVKSYRFAKAVHSLTKLKIDYSLSVRSSIRSFVSCPKSHRHTKHWNKHCCRGLQSGT